MDLKDEAPLECVFSLDAGEQLDRVGLLALGGRRALPRAPARELSREHRRRIAESRYW